MINRHRYKHHFLNGHKRKEWYDIPATNYIDRLKSWVIQHTLETSISSMQDNDINAHMYFCPNVESETWDNHKATKNRIVNRSLK